MIAKSKKKSIKHKHTRNQLDLSLDEGGMNETEPVPTHIEDVHEGKSPY